MRELFAQYNMVNFPMGNTGAQMGGWYNKGNPHAGRRQGLKIRIPGFGGEIWKRLGAEPVAMPGGEIAGALKDKKIDAGEVGWAYDDDKLGLPAVARFILPGLVGAVRRVEPVCQQSRPMTGCQPPTRL